MNDTESEAAVSKDQFRTLNDILDARWSCRGYLPDPLPRETVAEIVQTAQKVPSWCNAQPWQLIVAGPAETGRLRDKLFALPMDRPNRSDIPYPQRYSGRHLDRRREVGWQLYESVGVTKGDRNGAARQTAQNFRFFGAPHVAIVTSETELGPYGLVDCGAFITAFMLAARARGVASIAQAAIAQDAPVVREHFGIPENRTIVCAISFGLADEDHPANSFRTTRAPVDEVVDWRWV